jgi:hypothetical protein
MRLRPGFFLNSLRGTRATSPTPSQNGSCGSCGRRLAMGAAQPCTRSGTCSAMRRGPRDCLLKRLRFLRGGNTEKAQQAAKWPTTAGVTGHFKMHHLGSNQSAPPLRRGFCRLVGLVGQAAVLGQWRAGWLGGRLHPSPPEEGFGETWFPIQIHARSARSYIGSVVSVLAFLLPRSAALSCRR